LSSTKILYGHKDVLLYQNLSLVQSIAEAGSQLLQIKAAYILSG